ncbi:hypothetical protein DHEL01_v206587 [Diaporthe helianthi]|uniref:Uncharacterized protein n=1 Tax=Diaporthe helianthi TaxID=158607 RepID=A0A2P5HXP8_DIAHE|nr:hypothetical protein DHEL01_v206587 [Diaporthe helianthi]
MVQAITANMAPLAGVPGSYNHPSSKITKSRSKMVKPMLKKVVVSSPKNSLDLDRGWDDHISVYDPPARTSMSRSVRDASLPGSTWEPSTFGGKGPTSVPSSACPSSGTATPVAGLEIRRKQHTRTTSGTSIGTNGSGHRHGGAFVHPFQQYQTPRTNTPPLTYAHSFTSFERETAPRDYSPTIITENDDDDLDVAGSTPLSTSLSSHHHLHLHRPQPSNSHSTTSLRRPSITSQRTPSLTDFNSNVNNNPPLRVNTTPFSRSHPSTSSRLAHGSLNTSHSHSDLQVNGASPTDSPRPSLTLGSPTGSTPAAPMSPLRTSLEGAFRIRSRSEVDTSVNREDIREARRKFEENERLKQEKYESEQRKKRERKDSKLEKAASRRATGGSDKASIGRPSFSRKRTPPLSPSISSRHAQTRPSESPQQAIIDEKVLRPGSALMGSSYEGTENSALGPDINDIHFGTPKRAHAAKRRTQSYWTSFMLWLRTRLLKLGRR